ncbi:MAG: hypothetical protein ACRD2U_11205 [Terriglobales bacterium]
MKFRNISPAIVLLFFAASLLTADSKQPPAPHMSKQTRMDLISAFTADPVYIRTAFPMGKMGLTLKDGAISPSGEQLRQLIAMWGPSVKAGDRALISHIEIRGDRIRFEINGGPVKKLKWYQHITVGTGGGEMPIAPGDPQNNPRGTYVDLLFDHYVPDMNPRQLKNLLAPVFDFDSKTALQAYLETVPPKVKEAIEAHRVLVGMDREMVIYSKGRAAHKTREKDGETEYEEWIYGQPPEDVDFVRFVGDEVVRVETMTVTGEKVVRTEKEVNLDTSVAKAGAGPATRPATAPTLRRPGEEEPDTPGRSAPSPLPPMSAPPTTGPDLHSSS